MKKVLALCLCIAAFIIVVVVLGAIQKKPQGPKITSFKECADAGYPIMQSYPRQCSLPNGKFFVESTIPPQ